MTTLFWILTGTCNKQSRRVSRVHTVRPVCWHDVGVEVLHVLVPGPHQVLPETRYDRAGRGVLWVRTSSSVYGEIVCEMLVCLSVYP